jgi:biopolymer transport protein ExbB/TolQ
MIEIGSLLKTYIYLISASLLYPVLFILALLTLAVVVLAGGCFAEWLERARLRQCPPQQLPDLLKTGAVQGRVAYRVVRYVRDLQELAGGPQAPEAAVENLLQSATLRLWKSMDRLRMLVRIAPSLGLIGTLIPMGTGLAALGQGDMTRLSADLVIAFTTTVTGLAIGTLAFFLYTVRRRWVEEDIKNMELATEMLVSQRETNPHALHEQTPDQPAAQRVR